MLRASHRLSVRQFDETFKKGRVLHSSLFTLRYIAPTAAPAISRIPAKIAAVASQKVSKTAVGRIHLRRKTYESVKIFYPRIKKGASVIIFIKSAQPQNDVKSGAQIDAQKDLEQLFLKAGLLG